MKSNKSKARLAGVLYLVLIICGVYAELYVRSTLFVPADAAATAQNISNAGWLFRMGFVSDLIMLTTYFFLPLVLYLILHSVHKYLARLMVLCVVVAVSIMCVNMLNHIAAILLLEQPEYAKGLGAEQLQTLVLFFLDMHKHGYYIAQIFFGLWLYPLGYLIYKSELFPRIIGILLMLGAAGHLADLFVFFLLPGSAELLSSVLNIPATLGEFSLCLWLLIKGAKDSKVIQVRQAEAEIK